MILFCTNKYIHLPITKPIIILHLAACISCSFWCMSWIQTLLLVFM